MKAEGFGDSDANGGSAFDQTDEGLATAASKTKRISALLRPEDQRNLRKICELQGGISDVEAIRRSLNLARQLLEWVKEEQGSVILQKGRRRESIRFI